MSLKLKRLGAVRTRFKVGLSTETSESITARL